MVGPRQLSGIANKDIEIEVEIKVIMGLFGTQILQFIEDLTVIVADKTWIKEAVLLFFGHFDYLEFESIETAESELLT